MPRTILVHLNVSVPDGDERGANAPIACTLAEEIS